jgi:hypothetical protein
MSRKDGKIGSIPPKAHLYWAVAILIQLVGQSAWKKKPKRKTKL